MGGNQGNKNSFGRITSGIKLRASVLEIINFISVQLPFWRDDPARVDEQSETKLNSQLCDFLDSRAREDLPMFRFHHEEPQVGRKRVDLSAKPIEKVIIEAQTFTKYDPILVVECKRLPAPSVDREREYVTGPSPQKITGGIQRFKLGLHGAKHDMAAMVGYMQDYTDGDWLSTINKWIKELAVKPIGDGCVWSDDEILHLYQPNIINRVYKCKSEHRRRANTRKIEIHHIWISMRGKSA
jgi:hypothetical protein